MGPTHLSLPSLANLRTRWSSLSTPRRVALILALGALLQLLNYARARPSWIDEQSLQYALTTRSPLDFQTPLANAQLAPAGFVVAESTLAHVTRGSIQTLRLIPLATMLLALAAYGLLVVRLLESPAAELAAALFAVSASLVYYSSELKPYAGDVLVAAAASAFAVGLIRGRSAPREQAHALVLGTLAPWWAFASAFVLPVAAVVWLIQAARKHEPRALVLPVIATLLWAVSQAASLQVARQYLGSTDRMRAFWSFAFPPLPPRTLDQALALAPHALNLFADAARIATPLGPKLSALLALSLVIVGTAALIRQGRGPVLAVLLGPIALHVVAAALSLYPFHGRLCLYQSALLLPLAAQGLAALMRLVRPPILRLPLVVFFLATPAWETILRIDKPTFRFHDPHGDLHPDPFPQKDLDQPPR